MRKFMLGLALLPALVFADVARVVNGERSYHNGENVKGTYALPCDYTEGAALSANTTPVVVQFVASLTRKGTLYNGGAQVLRYRTSQWGLPYDWETVYAAVPAASSKDIDLSGVQQLWAWSAAAQTPVPSYIGCYATNAAAFVPTLTATRTITPTITQTFTPSVTPTITETVTPTATPTP